MDEQLADRLAIRDVVETWVVARDSSQTKMTIMQRGTCHDVECDVACTGRFYDFFANRNGHWAITGSSQLRV